MSSVDYKIFDHLIDTYLYLARAGGYEAGTEGNVYVLTRFPSLTFNFIYLKDADDGLIEKFIATNVPFCSFADPSLIGSDLIFQKYNMQFVENVKAHQFNEVSSFKYIPSGSIEISRVATDLQLDMFDQISSSCFQDTPGYTTKFLGSLSTTEEFEIYLAYKDRKPIGTVALSTVNDCAGLYWLSVLPEYRNQGVASEMVRFVINRAKDKGFDQICSQNYQASVTLFQRLSFMPSVELPLYVYRKLN